MAKRRQKMATKASDEDKWLEWAKANPRRGNGQSLLDYCPEACADLQSMLQSYAVLTAAPNWSAMQVELARRHGEEKIPAKPNGIKLYAIRRGWWTRGA